MSVIVKDFVIAKFFHTSSYAHQLKQQFIIMIIIYYTNFQVSYGFKLVKIPYTRSVVC